MFTAEIAQDHVRQLEAELAVLEVEFERIGRRISAVRKLIEGYRELFPADTPKAEATGTRPRLRALFDADPSAWHSVREVLEAITDAGWSTSSKDPVAIVRNELAQLSERGELDKQFRPDGSVQYRKTRGKPVMAE